MKVLRPDPCSICGELAIAMCSICGQPTCKEHMDPRSGACSRCGPRRSQDRPPSKGPSLM